MRKEDKGAGGRQQFCAPGAGSQCITLGAKGVEGAPDYWPHRPDGVQCGSDGSDRQYR